MVFNAFNNISAILRQSVLLVEKTGVSGENHRHAGSHWHLAMSEIYVWLKLKQANMNLYITSLIETFKPIVSGVDFCL
jgi:hypothetical protein